MSRCLGSRRTGLGPGRPGGRGHGGDPPGARPAPSNGHAGGGGRDSADRQPAPRRAGLERGILRKMMKSEGIQVIFFAGRADRLCRRSVRRLSVALDEPVRGWTVVQWRRYDMVLWTKRTRRGDVIIRAENHGRDKNIHTGRVAANRRRRSGMSSICRGPILFGILVRWTMDWPYLAIFRVPKRCMS